MRTYKFLLTASIIASILSTISSWFFYSRWEEMEDTHFDLEKKNNELSSSYQVLEMSYDSTMAVLDIMTDPEFRCISLYAKDSPQKDRMRIYWNPYNRSTFLEALSLPALDKGQEYRLYCEIGHQNTLITTFSNDGTNEHLIPAGKVAVAEHWKLYGVSSGDTLPPSADQLLLSSY